MLVFENDYSEGAHPLVLEKLLETNMEKLSGYGNDRYTEEAREKIRKAVGKEDADVFFIAGGTQTNLVIISTMLKRYEGVIAAVTGHVNGHEAGAIEYTGHKVMTLPHHDGKIDPEELDEMISGFYKDANHEHMVFPGMVYVSHPTEYGTLYSDKELTAISEICHRYDIPLFLDGARLGYALACPDSDLTLERIAELADVFYIGGTKVGALCGEAVVFTRKTPEHFLTMTKQQGAMLAKGRLLGVQFSALFTDNLYTEIAGNAIRQARKLKQALIDKGYKMAIDSPTNQLFVILDSKTKERLSKDVRFGFWERIDDEHTVVRFATSWATTDEDIEKLIGIL